MNASGARLALFVLAVSVFAWVRSARAVEHNFVGSAQLDYNFAPTAPDANANMGTNYTFDGFTLEAAGKLSVDVSDHLSVNVKVCFGCHGFEADMFYFDYRVADELNFRAGRFSPSFGAFNIRHDPANHKASDKPLPYDMGRMLRKTEWNNGVLPSPFPDNGIEVDGTHWFGESAQFDYAAWAVEGFRNDVDPHPADLDFVESHAPTYFVDNNARPTAGARMAMTLTAGPSSEMTLGASGSYGTYDPNNKLTYAILGGDYTLRLHRTSIRMEYLVRRTEMDVTVPGEYKYAVLPNGNFNVKHGAYLELERPIVHTLEFVARVDGMYRVGNVLAEAPYNSLSFRSSVIRETLGLALPVERNFRLKASGELWQFSDPSPTTGRRLEVSAHLAFVATF
jgi:hypothetical protein